MASGLDGTISLATIGYGTIGQGSVADPTDGQVFTAAEIAVATAGPYRSFPAAIIEWSPTTLPHQTPVWENITDLCLQGSVIRGRASEFDSIQAGKFNGLFENHTRVFDPTVNPGCRPRRLLRARVGSGNGGLRTTGSLSGAWTPPSPAMNITGDIAMIARVALDDWTPAADSILCAKIFFAGNQASYGFGVTTTGALTFAWSTDGGTGGLVSRTSTAPVAAAAGETRWVRVTLDADNGAGGHDVRFWVSTTETNRWQDVTWTQLGSTVTNPGAAVIHAGTSVVAIGALPENLSNTVGWTYAAAILNSAGVAVVDIDFTDPAQFAPNANTGIDAVGNPWHVSHGPNQPDGVIGNLWGMFVGYIDDLPQAYDHHGAHPTVQLTATDGFWLAQDLDMQGAYDEIVRADNPAGWWRLDDDVPDDTLCADSSGNALDGQYRGNPTKADDPLIANRGGAVTFDADNNDKVWIDPLANIVTAPFTVEAWVKSGTVTGPNKTAEIVCQSYDSGALGSGLPGQGTLVLGIGSDPSNPANAHAILDTDTLQGGGQSFGPGFGWGLGFELAQQAGTNYPLFSFTDDTGVSTVAVGTQSIAAQTAVDDNTHHLVGTVGFDRRARLYVDGVLVAVAPTATPTAVIAGGGSTGRIRFASPPTLPDDTTYRRWNGTLDDVAIYPSALTATQVLDHYQAGVDGWAGDLPGARIDRMLDLVGIPAGDRDLDTGASVLQGDVGSQTALAHMQDVAKTEQGRLFVGADGRWRLIGRHAELTDPRALEVQATFTSDASDYDALDFDYGARTLINDVRVTPRNGAEQRQSDQDSIDEYGTQTRTFSGTLQSAADARGLCQWVLMHYADPLVRTGRMVVIPQRDEATLVPALFPLEIGDRVLVDLTLTGDDISTESLIEGITHRFGRGQLWTTELRLSPANTLTGFLILNDPAGGLLDTARLAY